jgi:hypothetical protein
MPRAPRPEARCNALLGFLDDDFSNEAIEAT